MHIEATDLYTARAQGAQAMEQGLSWHEAAKRAGLEICQSTAYRLRQRMRQRGEQALREGRYGHLINCEVKCTTGWNRPGSLLLIRPAHEIQT
jgi:hypothetical protein